MSQITAHWKTASKNQLRTLQFHLLLGWSRIHEISLYCLYLRAFWQELRENNNEIKQLVNYFLGALTTKTMELRMSHHNPVSVWPALPLGPQSSRGQHHLFNGSSLSARHCCCCQTLIAYWLATICHICTANNYLCLVWSQGHQLGRLTSTGYMTCMFTTLISSLTAGSPPLLY